MTTALSTVDLTVDEEAGLAAKLAELYARGYQDIAGHGTLRVGTRIRHRGQQYTAAFRVGTGFVVALTDRPDSSWSRTYRLPDIELVVLFDKPWPYSRLSVLAHYHVCVIEPMPEID